MSKSIKETISKNISKFRKESGLSQKELAEKIGAKNLTTVSSWERGISSPDADTIIKLCELFHVSLNDLYNIENKEIELSLSEKNHIKKYRSLNDSGKEMVNMVLEKEYERSKVETTTQAEPIETTVDNGSLDFDHLMPIAAHLDNPSEEQMALVQKDLERLMKLKEQM